MKQKKKKKQNGILFMAASLLFGALTGVVVGILMTNFLPDLNFPLFVLCVFLTMYLQLILHEAGHMVFGLLTGYRFTSFRVGSLMLLKENGRFVFRRFSLSGTGGQCLMAPPEWNDGCPYVLYNLGGSLMNLLTSLLAFVLLKPLSSSLILSHFLVVFAAFGVCFALLNGVPFHTSTVDNDGANIVSMSKSKEALRAFWIQLKISEYTAQGLRLRDMPGEWFTMPPHASMNNSMISTLAVFRCNRLLDEGRIEECYQEMRTLMDDEDVNLIQLYRYMLTADCLFCEAVGENRPEVIRDYLTKELDKFMKSMKRYPSILRTRYALALLHDKDEAKAAGFLKDFEKVSTTHPYPSEIQSERELIRNAEFGMRNNPSVSFADSSPEMGAKSNKTS